MGPVCDGDRAVKSNVETVRREMRALLRSPEFRDGIRRGEGSKLFRGCLKHNAVTGWTQRRQDGRRRVRALECNNAAIRRLIKMACGGDADADAVLRDITSDLLKGGVPPGPTLANYIAKALTKPGGKVRHRPGPDPNARRIRNCLIAEMVERAMKRGLNPTRNHDPKSKDEASESACSIVAQELVPVGCLVSEDAVAKIFYSARKAQSTVGKIKPI